LEERKRNLKFKRSLMKSSAGSPSKRSSGYELTWRSPNVTTLRVSSEPVIDDDVQIKREDDTIQVLTTECRLKLITKDGETEAHISKI